MPETEHLEEYTCSNFMLISQKNPKFLLKKDNVPAFQESKSAVLL